MLRKALVGIGVLFALFLLIQLIPYGHSHDDPPVTKAVPLPPAAEQLMTSSCGACHSNLTKWPWYSNVAPVSWLVQNDVDEGRSHLNFSEWDHPQPALEELVGKISSGDMPPFKYTIEHSDAKLSATGKKTLIAGLKHAYSTDPPPQARDDGDE